jgi:hypothetical protein
MQHKEEAKTEMRSKISEGLFLSVNSVISERSNFYAKNPDKRPAQHSVSSIVDKYKYLNASIVGTLNLIPGPLGMLVVVPELLAVMRNQLAMIYDIGTAYGHEKKITAEMLIGIFASVTMGGRLGAVRHARTKGLGKENQPPNFAKDHCKTRRPNHTESPQANARQVATWRRRCCHGDLGGIHHQENRRKKPSKFSPKTSSCPQTH